MKNKFIVFGRKDINKRSVSNCKETGKLSMTSWHVKINCFYCSLSTFQSDVFEWIDNCWSRYPKLLSLYFSMKTDYLMLLTLIHFFFSKIFLQCGKWACKIIYYSFCYPPVINTRKGENIDKKRKCSVTVMLASD